MVIDELQTVPVASYHHAVPGFLPAASANRADHIIGLPALAGKDGDPHGLQHILQNRHLLRQLLRHFMAGGLVAIIPQVPECGPMEIEGYAQGIRLFLRLHFLKNIQKSKDGMGIQTLPGGQGSDPIKGPVYHTVAIQNHELHISLFSIWRPGGCQ